MLTFSIQCFFVVVLPFKTKKYIEEQTNDLYDPHEEIDQKQLTKLKENKKKHSFQSFLIYIINKFNQTKSTDLIVANCKFQMQNNKKNQYMSQNSSNDSFQLQPHQMKKLGFKKNKNKLAAGSWSPEENRIYLEFLINYQQDFKTQQMRRKSKVFYRISKLLKRRTPDQCRSHHQKLFNKNKRDYQKLIKQLLEKAQDSEKGIQQILERKKLLKTQQIQFKSQKEEERKTMMIQQEPYKINQKQNGLHIAISIHSLQSW